MAKTSSGMSTAKKKELIMRQVVPIFSTIIRLAGKSYMVLLTVPIMT